MIKGILDELLLAIEHIRHTWELIIKKLEKRLKLKKKQIKYIKLNEKGYINFKVKK